MRALVVGAVEGTRVAAQTIASCPGWTLAGIMTLRPDLAARHSDFADLAPEAAASGAELIHVASSNSPEACARVTALAPDYTFVIGWSQICGPEFRAAASGQVLGYHPAALPRLRGRATLPWTILLDEKIAGSSLFWIDDGVDSGDILAQRFFHVAPRETAASLYAKHMATLRSILGEALPRLAAGEQPRTPQDAALATYATRRRPEDGRIDWSRPAAEIDRLIRAVGRPYPGAFTELAERRFTIWSAEPASGTGLHAIPGQVIAIETAGFSVACGDGNVIRVTDFSADPSDDPPGMHTVLGQRP
jgi:methionyl-tRNA formyltransferase